MQRTLNNPEKTNKTKGGKISIKRKKNVLKVEGTLNSLVTLEENQNSATPIKKPKKPNSPKNLLKNPTPSTSLSNLLLLKQQPNPHENQYQYKLKQK